MVVFKCVLMSSLLNLLSMPNVKVNQIRWKGLKHERDWQQNDYSVLPITEPKIQGAKVGFTLDGVTYHQVSKPLQQLHYLRLSHP